MIIITIIIIGFFFIVVIVEVVLVHLVDLDAAVVVLAVFHALGPLIQDHGHRSIV